MSRYFNHICLAGRRGKDTNGVVCIKSFSARQKGRRYAVSSLGEKIKMLRKQRGLSTTQLADKTGLSQTYISRLENGKRTSPSQSALQKIAAALDTNIYRLLYQANAADSASPILPDEIKLWLMKEDILPYLELAKDLYREKIPASQAKKIIDTVYVVIRNKEDKPL